MFVLNAITNLCKVWPFIFEAMSPSFCVFLETSFINLWVIREITLNKINLLVAYILLLDIAQYIVMKLSVETEEHFRVIKITTFPHLLIH